KPRAQQHLLEYYIEQKVDAIVLAPMDRKTLNPYLEKASKAGIKIVIVDSPVTTDSIDCFIATDNYKAGAMGAELMVSKLNSAGPILVVGHSPDNGSERETRISTEEILKNTPCIAGVFTTNEATSDGVLHVMQDRNGTHIPFIAFDYNQKLLEGVRNKQIEALITQRPYALGFFGVRSAIELLNGKKVSKQM
ncbi:substrate-binding domain-containing protein, partial [Aduncisulcus paluster]